MRLTHSMPPAATLPAARHLLPAACRLPPAASSRSACSKTPAPGWCSQTMTGCAHAHAVLCRAVPCCAVLACLSSGDTHAQHACNGTATATATGGQLSSLCCVLHHLSLPPLPAPCLPLACPLPAPCLPLPACLSCLPAGAVHQQHPSDPVAPPLPRHPQAGDGAGGGPAGRGLQEGGCWVSGGWVSGGWVGLGGAGWVALWRAAGG